MIEEYLYKTLISFISLKATLILFREQWLQLNPKRNGFIKRNFNVLLPCLIPVFRWLWVITTLILSIALNSPEFVEKCKEKLKK